MKGIFYPKAAISFLICIGIFSNCKKDVKEIPTLITVIISSVTEDSVLMGGLIVDDGSADITARGVCYGTGPGPKISGQKTTDGRGKGTFISSIKGLIPNTKYYARAYATNSEGTGYGNEITFETLPGEIVAPLVVTASPYVSFFYSIVTGRIISDGGAPVTERGICWATSDNPSIYDNQLIYTGSFITQFEVKLDSLQPDSYYYARAYAINSADTSYGNIVTVKTLAVPEVLTKEVIEITKNSAKAVGNVVTLGNASDVYSGYTIEVGICYGTGKDPSIEGLHVRTANATVGEFTCDLEELTPGVQYYVRAYVLWGSEWVGSWVVYGNEITYITPE